MNDRLLTYLRMAFGVLALAVASIGSTLGARRRPA
jgi:hypothetical protein